jgi:hypothetical protein
MVRLNIARVETRLTLTAPVRHNGNRIPADRDASAAPARRLTGPLGAAVRGREVSDIGIAPSEFRRAARKPAAPL